MLDGERQLADEVLRYGRTVGVQERGKTAHLLRQIGMYAPAGETARPSSSNQACAANRSGPTAVPRQRTGVHPRRRITHDAATAASRHVKARVCAATRHTSSATRGPDT